MRLTAIALLALALAASDATADPVGAPPPSPGPCPPENPTCPQECINVEPGGPQIDPDNCPQ